VEGETVRVFRGKSFLAAKAWGAVAIATMNGITTRLHWTDQPYHWHRNQGDEVFAVLDGEVEMKYRLDGKEHSTMLYAGDVFLARGGCEHKACPVGQARILVIEQAGSD
jgi:mannose-6-phosphate isomerase-like protein (cupin superfamily)